MYITIFGGSSPKPEDQAYKDAEKLGAMLASDGHAVLTGGYIGIMEAVSKGASKANGHVIGVTCEEIESWRPVKVNEWVMEEKKFPTLHERMLSLINECDIAIAVPGGVGTLTEVMLMWNRMLIRSINEKPLILIGNEWHEIIKKFIEMQNIYMKKSDKMLLSFVKDIESAVDLINKYSKSTKYS